MKGIQGQICDGVHDEHEHKAESWKVLSRNTPDQSDETFHSLFVPWFAWIDKYFLKQEITAGSPRQIHTPPRREAAVLSSHAVIGEHKHILYYLAGYSRHVTRCDA